MKASITQTSNGRTFINYARFHQPDGSQVWPLKSNYNPMKKSYLIALIMFLSLGSAALAQRPAIDQEKLQAARIAFITTRIDLKPEQAEKFWPIFNEYNEARETTMRQISQLGKDIESISEEEAKSRIQKRLQLQSELLKEEQAFVNDAAKVLSSKQILMLNNIARDFNRHLYQRGRDGK